MNQPDPTPINIKETLINHIRWWQELGITHIYDPDLKDRLQIWPQSSPMEKKTLAPIQKVKIMDEKPKTEPDTPLPASLVEYRQQIGDCKKCHLHQTRTKFVFGEGNPNADIMFIGEAPGAEEDQQGEPFVGAAGQLLTKILAAIDLTREEVYIANILKCRPPNNRDPQPLEVEHCEPYLINQIKLIRPRIICALGRISAQTLLKTKQSLSSLRGKIHTYQNIKLIVTYHPAALLRYPNYKRDTWEDMKMLRRIYQEELDQNL